ncbi:hypothetical protein LCGC14_1537910 [marine sediment metagenome]|uniref:PD-(D/E)XK endonuclease-like domain-containing protein n=1 Tax=marine sediment metagenome TaxID=412755 RepID=A0A0F9LUS8_9ZZZZ
MKGLDVLTHSRISCFKACRYRHYLEYECGLRRERDATPLRIGTQLHLGLECMAKAGPLLKPAALHDFCMRLDDQYADIPAWVTDVLKWLCEAEIIKRLLYGYLWRWGDDGWQTLAAEETFNLPIPGKQHATRTYRIAGKLDQAVLLPDARTALVEHKSTKRSIEPDSDYWKQVQLSDQVTEYFWAKRQLGQYLDTIILDAIHVPGMGPKYATPEENRKYTKAGKLYANQRECDETPAEYGERLTADITEHPDTYFVRREIPRLDADMTRFLRDLYQVQAQIRDASRNGLHYRSTDACTSPYRCNYLDFCREGYEPGDEAPPGFVVVDNIHQELEEHDISTTNRDDAKVATATECEVADIDSDGRDVCSAVVGTAAV